jgi:hypothetical protein
MTTFGADSDWMFASPFKLGRQPYSYAGVWRELQRAAKAAGIGKLGTHSFRHTHRAWLDAVGTPVAVQQKMMRHSDMRTSGNSHHCCQLAAGKGTGGAQPRDSSGSADQEITAEKNRQLRSRQPISGKPISAAAQPTLCAAGDETGELSRAEMERTRTTPDFSVRDRAQDCERLGDPTPGPLFTVAS